MQAISFMTDKYPLNLFLSSQPVPALTFLDKTKKKM
jgi:hypothetical protein